MEPKIGCGKGHSAAKRFQLDAPADIDIDVVAAAAGGDDNDEVEVVGRRSGEDKREKSLRYWMNVS